MERRVSGLDISSLLSAAGGSISNKGLIHSFFSLNFLVVSSQIICLVGHFM